MQTVSNPPIPGHPQLSRARLQAAGQL